VLLAYDEAAPGPDALPAKRAAVAAYLDVLDAGSLDLVVLVVQAVAATTGLRSLALAPAESLGAGKAGRRARGGAAATSKAAPSGR